ncbi:hypothetical protein FVO59_15295 [Microbacterium esteraromaticum]|uniref:PepSY domain-containing protein n=1 Tax=Microbacterium esteraromaticum TaxID=57043 RepID=A0A7D7WHQ9_9MICO|nr:hypothetical protein [Microbacterium esteraromaticum]QMU98391.1 hypothetical protein FVO59_15295 [Microbacterium esteraromaticum]
MQLGTRWRAGAQPPSSVPATLLPAISEVEAQGLTGHWTLTWLEGRAIAELDAGWEVVETATGEVIARPFED